MATGKHPFNRHGTANLLSLAWDIAQLSQDPSKIPKLPTKLSAGAHSFLEACLHIVPEERWSTERLLRHGYLV